MALEQPQPASHQQVLTPLDSIQSESAQLDSQLERLLGNRPASQPAQGISLLDLKNHLLLSYIHNLINLIATRIAQTDSGHDEDDKAQKIVQQLVWIRLVVEKLRPMEARLKYQIEKLLKTVEEVDLAHQSDQLNIDHIVNDPLSFKPNPNALEAADNQTTDQVDAPEVQQTHGMTQHHDEKSAGVYRPPRVAPVAYPEVSSKTKRPAPAPVALREAISLSAAAPQAESTTGLANTAAKASGRAKALARMNEYEEANMMRLFSSKKEARRRRDDEAAVALGIETSTGRATKRRLGALEGEFAGVLGDISKQGDRYSAYIGPSSSRKPPKPSSDYANPFGGQQTGKKRRKSTFTKAVAKISKKNA